MSIRFYLKLNSQLQSLRIISSFLISDAILYFLISGIEPWTFEQKLGEAVFIPAGCPHQVRNLKVNIHGSWIVASLFACSNNT